MPRKPRRLLIQRNSSMALILVAALNSCSSAPKPSGAALPPVAHLIVSDGTPVPGAPEPEVVQLVRIEVLDRMKHVAVGNGTGDYMLVCDPDANRDYGVSCLSPRPGRDYLLFTADTRWLMKGAARPMSLQFMQDFSVTYTGKENVGLVPARGSDGDGFGVYYLLAWTARGRGR